MLKRLILTALLLCAPLWVGTARAQDQAQIVVACGTPPRTYSPGSVATLTMDVTGTLCTGGSDPSSLTTVNIAPSASAAIAGTDVESPSAEVGRNLKASAGNIYGINCTIGATAGYLMLFDSLSIPADGAVTPKWWQFVSSNGTQGGISVSWNPGPPEHFATGITWSFSTTGPFTKTGSATAACTGLFQ